MKHIGLFEGIGGFSLAARWAGWETTAWCEWNEFGQKVLKHHFPKAIPHGDITKTDFTIYRGQCDIVTGGFPCQPYSAAGKRLGKEDERHLWPEMLRAIREIQPRWVVGENVRGLTNWNGGMVFDEVQADLENIGYEVIPFLLPACAVDAPHRRDRIWFVAYRDISSKRSSGEDRETESNGSKNNDEQEGRRTSGKFNIGCGKFLQPPADANGFRQSRQKYRKEKARRIAETFVPADWQNFPTQSPICDGNDGFPTKLDGITFPKWRNESIKSGGNAIVPQLAYQIFKAINKYESNKINYFLKNENPSSQNNKRILKTCLRFRSRAVW